MDASASAGPADIRQDMQEVADAASKPAPVVAETPAAAPEPVAEAAAPTPAEGTGDRPRGPDGKFIPKDGGPAKAEAEPAARKATPETQEATPAAARPEGTSPAKPPASAVPADRPPQSWKPAEREAWEKIPEPARQAIVRREREAARALQEGAEARKTHEAMRATIAPHEQRIRARGGDPFREIGGMLQVDAILAGGPLDAKAQVMASLLKHAGLTDDSGIAALAKYLDGAPAAPPPPPQEFRDPRLDALFAQLEQQKAQREQQETEEFASNHEFFADVSDSMKKFQQAGLAKTLEEAYDQACWANPEVRAIIQRREHETAKAQQASTQSALAAASSLRSEPTSAVAVAGGSDSILADMHEVATRVRRR